MTTRKRAPNAVQTALVGHTGFVGSNIAAHHEFDDTYNSSNLDRIAGRHYDLVVSAAARADSYRINNDEAGDAADIDGIIERLSSASIDKLVFISTVCIFPAGGAPDEDAEIDPSSLTPYGRNRLRMERTLSERFDTLALRLPQLYGTGLKKGVVYDLANNHRVEHLQPSGVFQYYGLDRLWSDITVGLENDLPSLNLATPPLTTEEVAEQVFGIDLSGQEPAEPASPFSAMYTRNMTTTHDALFGRDDGYLMSRADSLASLSRFVTALTH